MATTTATIEISDIDSRPTSTHEKPANKHDVAHQLSSSESSSDTPPKISKGRATIIIGAISLVSFLNNLTTGLLVVSLPTMARELNLPANLLLWPASVNTLATGCTLLLSGSIADIIGGKPIYLTGVFFMTVATIACGVCKTGIQLILFRAASGVAISLALPSSVMLITKNIPSGSYRNTAFACLGAGQPLGFSIGLVIGGLFVDSIGWRFGYYIGAILTFIIFVVSFFGIPSDTDPSQTVRNTLHRIRNEIDWIGIGIISTSLGLFSYVFSVLAGNKSNFLKPSTLAVFSVAVVLLPAFVFYIKRQERLGARVVLPSSVWESRVFTCLCITVFLMWGAFEAILFFLTLFFQEIQGLSAIQTSIRFLPSVVTGGITNLLTGWLVQRVRADILVLCSAIISAISPLLMAIVNPAWSYWICAFFAVACSPICADVLFTVANLLITNVFPSEAHGLAGGVFNMIANIGQSIGVAIAAVVAGSVTAAAVATTTSTFSTTSLDITTAVETSTAFSTGVASSTDTVFTTVLTTELVPQPALPGKRAAPPPLECISLSEVLIYSPASISSAFSCLDIPTGTMTASMGTVTETNYFPTTISTATISVQQVQETSISSTTQTIVQTVMIISYVTFTSTIPTPIITSTTLISTETDFITSTVPASSCVPTLVLLRPTAIIGVVGGVSTTSYDDDIATITLPFPITFCSQTSATVRVSVNGWMAIIGIAGDRGSC
ncbi:hypothetical protein VTL71DRAFT_147 [Oculimacula yallundae]|uniref:Major facilitator superfamily (MFS) profile domain-containing protein n=1 Tax=Oculimacula yallundae TaxID=86028 RepID=A0ABR4CZ58_9HELO